MTMQRGKEERLDKLFESFVDGVVRSYLIAHGYADVAQIAGESAHRQRGRDIRLSISADVALLGIPISLVGRQSAKVFIECKFTSEKQLGLESFAHNSSQNAHGECDYFILVTNANLTANAYYELLRQFRKSGAGVGVIDGTRLQACAAELGYSEFPFPLHSRPVPECDGVAYEVAFENRTDVLPQAAEVTLVLRNLRDEPVRGVFYPQSHEEWQVVAEGDDRPEIPYTLPPHGFTARRWAISRAAPDCKSEYRFGLRVGDVHVHIKSEFGPVGEHMFHADYCGVEHCRIRGELRALLAGPRSGRKVRLLSLTGEAGTGKSRLVEEIAGPAVKVTHFQFTGKHQDPALLIKALRDGGMRLDGDTISIATCLDVLLSLRPPAIPMPNVEHLLVLDDAHLADEHICKFLRGLIDGERPPEMPVMLMIVGRSDFSHGNVDFDRLVTALRSPALDWRRHDDLGALDEDGFKTLVSQMLPGIPDKGIEAIDRLSRRVPQNVIQCIEWLMNKRAIRVQMRRALGITDTFMFNWRKDSLPSSMAELLNNRYVLLEKQEAGRQAQLLLACAALLGAAVPHDVGELVGEECRSQALGLLDERRFLRPAQDGRIRWHHESLLLHYRNWLLDELLEHPSPLGIAEAACAARAILGHGELSKGLSPWDLGLLNSLAGNDDAALEHWRDLLDTVARIEGWSTVNIDADCYPYLRWLMKSLEVASHRSPLLPKLALAMAYVGGYCRSLSDGIRAVEFGKAQLRKNKSLDHATKERAICWLGAKAAHFRLDAGYVRQCLGDLNELQARYANDPVLQEDRRLGFEIHNCLGMLFGYMNDRTVGEWHFQLADKAISGLGDQALEAKQPGDRAAMYQFSNLVAWERLTALSSQLNTVGGTVRHLSHANLGDILLDLTKVASHSAYKDYSSVLRTLYQRAREVEENCEAAAYYSVMPRILLLQAVILYVQATHLDKSKQDPELLRIVDNLARRGMGFCLERGVGYSDWQLANLRGLVAMRLNDEEGALGHFANAFELMRTGGLLFLGRADLSAPTQIIAANYIKFLHHHRTDGEVSAALRWVTSYDAQDHGLDARREIALASALHHHALLSPKEAKAGLLLDRGLEPPMAVVAWY